MRIVPIGEPLFSFFLNALYSNKIKPTFFRNITSYYSDHHLWYLLFIFLLRQDQAILNILFNTRFDWANILVNTVPDHFNFCLHLFPNTILACSSVCNLLRAEILLLSNASICLLYLVRSRTWIWSVLVSRTYISPLYWSSFVFILCIYLFFISIAQSS